MILLEYSQPLLVMELMVVGQRDMMPLENLTDQVFAAVVWLKEVVADKTKRIASDKFFMEVGFRVTF